MGDDFKYSYGTLCTSPYGRRRGLENIMEASYKRKMRWLIKEKWNRRKSDEKFSLEDQISYIVFVIIPLYPCIIVTKANIFFNKLF